MSANDELERLRQFFGAYFHQDWPDEANTTTEIVDRYRADVGLEEAKQVATDIEQLLARTDDLTLEHTLFRELGCYYYPTADGLTAREWLAIVRQQLVSSP